MKDVSKTKAEKPTTAIGPIELNDGDLDQVSGGPKIQLGTSDTNHPSSSGHMHYRFRSFGTD